MSSFFTTPSGQKKRKRDSAVEPPKKRFASSKPSKPSKDPKPPRKPQRDESISGSEDESAAEAEKSFFDEGGESSSSEEEGGDAEETAAERRLRLAERYLENIREEVDEVGFDAEEIDRDLIAERLKEDGAESKGRMYRKLASTLSFEEAEYSQFKNNTETITSVATCLPFAYTVSKDLYLTKWRIQDLPKDQWKDPHPLSKKRKPPPPPKRKPELLKTVKGDKKKSKDNTYLGHVDSILTVACSQDGKFVVTGSRDRRIVVWSSDLKPLRVFSQHRDAVTGLAFRRGTNQMYSSSADRTIKIWSLDELAYVETLFGHQDAVVDVAALAQERCISVGARDRTARLWKVVEETQLVFRGGGGSKKSKNTVQEGSMDRIAMIDEELFVTGGDNGNLSLWTMHKKKPVFTLPLTHGLDPALPLEEVSAEAHPDPAVIPQPQPRWITALATIPYSDIILSGSWDGFVRVWRVSDDKKKIEAVGVISTPALTASSIKLESPLLNLNGHSLADINGVSNEKEEPRPIVRGVINDISIFERGDRGKDGVCVVIATGKELRMGRWKKIEGGRNGAVVFEIPKLLKSNGVLHEGDEDE